eukprot:CAMPEP_0178406702 /NCGR_PEP_ID=MMETSP0689_2-20121128/19048_1 /TAXON_ID=160604 /ORGANISM="Amphidinium massartii, Strain CS-259" /LENGTH=427 /DNA_ID=CAMNT_0020027751 /DNA_START=78 /DNA_END=1357 /DNA_ORIENTATION=+
MASSGSRIRRHSFLQVARRCVLHRLCSGMLIGMLLAQLLTQPALVPSFADRLVPQSRAAHSTVVEGLAVKNYIPARLPFARRSVALSSLGGSQGGATKGLPNFIPRPWRRKAAQEHPREDVDVFVDTGRSVVLAELSRKFLHLPKSKWVGPGWEIMTASVDRAGIPVHLNLMLDSGLTSSMLPPHVARFLGLDQVKDGSERTFMAADGQQKGGIAQLQDLYLDTKHRLPLGSYSALVADFPQSRLGASLGCPIDGMLGMEFYDRFGVEVDKDVVRLYEPDACESAAKTRGMLMLRTTSLPARLQGISVAAVGGPPPPAGTSPWVLGILDTGSAYTVLSWAAAKLMLGITESPDDCGFINAMDISGKPISMPLVNASLLLSGASDGLGRGPVVDFESVEVAIGDIALFAKMVGNTSMPIALVGQDLLT